MWTGTHQGDVVQVKVETEMLLPPAEGHLSQHLEEPSRQHLVLGLQPPDSEA